MEYDEVVTKESAAATVVKNVNSDEAATSITENKHIFAAKKPWRRSSRFEALGQMLLTNQRLEKLDIFRDLLQEAECRTANVFVWMLLREKSCLYV